MLEAFFKYPKVLARMRSGPLAEEIDEIAGQLARDGYSLKTTIRYLSLVGSFSRYAERMGATKTESIDASIGERFVTAVSRSRGTRSVAHSAVRHTLRHLAYRYPFYGRPAAATDPDAALLAKYEAYLHEVRGLQRRSCEGPLRVARRMLAWNRGRPCGGSLSDLSGADVLTFVSTVAAKPGAHGARVATTSCVRGFLRYLRYEGIVEKDLARLVPRMASWRLARIPNYLTWADVRAVIEATDSSTAVGKRDRALLLLLATTGLRSSELRRLELRDIRWRAAEIHLRRTKTHRERLVPLLEEAGGALAEYILHGRPHIANPTVFLSHRPPVRPLSGSGVVAGIVRRRLAQCGIRPKRAGAHLLRHAVATRMVQQGRSIKQVADLLGHRSVDTTAVYVKVALPQLASVALAFPGGTP